MNRPPAPLTSAAMLEKRQEAQPKLSIMFRMSPRRRKAPPPEPVILKTHPARWPKPLRNWKNSWEDSNCVRTRRQEKLKHQSPLASPQPDGRLCFAGYLRPAFVFHAIKQAPATCRGFFRSAGE